MVVDNVQCGPVRLKIVQSETSKMNNAQKKLITKSMNVCVLFESQNRTPY